MRAYLEELRKQHNESKQDVATALNVTRQYYDMIERGERQKKMDTTVVFMLSNHFGVPAEDIMNAERKYQEGEAT